MIEITHEYLEAISREDILRIKELAATLHEATAGILDTPMTATQLREEKDLRTALVMKIREAVSFLSAQTKDLQAVMQDLRILQGWTGNDKSRIEGLMFDTLAKEKEFRSHS